MAKRGGDDVGLPDRPATRPREEAMEVVGGQQMDTGAGSAMLSGDMNAPASGSEIITVGKIKYDKNKRLGKGADGTLVYKGRFDGRDIAVKRIQVENEVIAIREVDHLIKLHEHDNVIRYYRMEQDRDFCYIALELALSTVENYVNGGYEGPEIDDISILRQACNGLQWLHSRKIIHRDVKPTNILLVKNKEGNAVTKLSDYGLSKELPESSTCIMTTGAGTRGWRAPEVLTHGRSSEFALAQDVFSMGCVSYYVLTKGEHPFGREVFQEGNIQHGKYSLSAVEDNSGRALIEKMIQSEPEKRPSAEDVVSHPFLCQMDQAEQLNQEMAAAGVTKIGDINAVSYNITIMARVTNKSSLRKYDGGVRLFFECLDNTVEIKCTVWNKKAKALEGEIKINRVYTITNMKAKMIPKGKKEMYQIVIEHEFELTLTPSSKIHEEQSQSLPYRKYNFTEINQLRNKPINERVDVIGVCVDVGKLGLHPWGNSTRDLQLVDESTGREQGITLKVKGQQADEIHQEPPFGVVLKRARLREHDNMVQITSGDNNMIQIIPVLSEAGEPLHQRAYALLKWFSTRN